MPSPPSPLPRSPASPAAAAHWPGSRLWFRVFRQQRLRVPCDADGSHERAPSSRAALEPCWEGGWSGAVHVLDLTLGPAMPGGGALPLPNQVGSFTACSGSHTLRNLIPLILLLLHCFSTALKRSALSHQL